jgi:ATP-dependent helicase/nuclease subunit A
VETHVGEIAVPGVKRLVSEPAAADTLELTGTDREWIERGRVAIETTLDSALARRPAVLSVSAVKQEAAQMGTEDVPPSLELAKRLREPAFARAPTAADGRMIGNAHHRFMQLADLKRLTSADAVREQVACLVLDGHLTTDEAGLLSPGDVAWFAGTAEGRWVVEQAERCRREVPFVYALPVGDDERMVLRGVIDLLLETDHGLVIMDYKTDRPRDEADWQQRIAGYSVQLQLYAAAVREVFGREVVGAVLIFLPERRVVPVPIQLPTFEAVLAQAGAVERLA